MEFIILYHTLFTLRMSRRGILYAYLLAGPIPLPADRLNGSQPPAFPIPKHELPFYCPYFTAYFTHFSASPYDLDFINSASLCQTFLELVYVPYLLYGVHYTLSYTFYFEDE